MIPLHRVLIVIACVAVPILWGVAVNWVFDRLARRAARGCKAQRDADKNKDDSDTDQQVIEYYI